jgi:hypothetical protein
MRNDLAEAHDLLMCATAYPFGGPHTVEAQLTEAKRATDGTVNAAMAYAAAQMEEEARRLSHEMK